METRGKKRKNEEQSSASATPIPTPAEFRDWPDLLDPLLLAILDLLASSIPDLFAFAAVCRSWRSIAKSSTTTTTPHAPCFSIPPLLLVPQLTPPPRGTRPRWRVPPGFPMPAPTSRAGRSRCPPRWSGPPRCRLQTLTHNNNNNLSPYYKTMVSSKTLSKRCIGYSRGYLIFDAGNKALVTDVFTGEEIQSPKFPRYVTYNFRISILTASPTSPSPASCLLILVASSCTLCWQPGSNEWAVENYLRYKKEMWSIAVCRGQVYCLDNDCRVKVVDFDPPVTWRTLEMKVPDPPSYGNLGKCLVECGGELLLVLFAVRTRCKCWLEVYRLELSKLVWVKLESIGDWCLFVDTVGNSPLACRNPTSWGGRNNCVYILGPGCDSWTMIPLDGSVIDTSTTESALHPSHRELPRWPSPIWVYPSMLF